MRISTFFLFIFCFVSVYTTQFATVVKAGTDPISTIKDVQKAIDTADDVLFEASVDMDSLIGQCVDIFVEDAVKGNASYALPGFLTMALAAAGQSEQAQQMLTATLRSEVGAFVRYGVRSGTFAGKKVETTSPSGFLAPLFADTSTGRKEIHSIGQPIAESGAFYVPFMLKDYGNGNDYPVEVWLRQQEGSWRVIGLRNVRTLVRIITEEKAQ